MKIGTSLGKCIKSILDEDVSYDEVLFIVSNTMCPTVDRLMDVVSEYYYAPPYSTYDFSDHNIEDAKALATKLFNDGKLHQPRSVGADKWIRNHRLVDTWYDIAPSPTTDNESVREAWNHYKMIANLAV
jgi:hypothetical protein